MENCKGCLSKEYYACGVNIYNDKDMVLCPCQTCIVKMMCKTSCYKFDCYIGKLNIRNVNYKYEGFRMHNLGIWRTVRRH